MSKGPLLVKINPRMKVRKESRIAKSQGSGMYFLAHSVKYSPIVRTMRILLSSSIVYFLCP